MKIAVYCASVSNLPAQYVDLAKCLGHWIGSKGHTLVYGGVNAGLMHVVAQATHDAQNGHICGVVPQVFAHRADPIADQVLHAQNLSDRKAMMIDMADAFVVLPGGIGTIDEWITTLSQISVNPDDNRRIIVVNPDGIFDAQAEQISATSRSIFARGHDFNAWNIFVNDIESLTQALNNLHNDNQQ